MMFGIWAIFWNAIAALFALTSEGVAILILVVGAALGWIYGLFKTLRNKSTGAGAP